MLSFLLVGRGPYYSGHTDRGCRTPSRPLLSSVMQEEKKGRKRRPSWPVDRHATETSICNKYVRSNFQAKTNADHPVTGHPKRADNHKRSRYVGVNTRRNKKPRPTGQRPTSDGDKAQGPIVHAQRGTGSSQPSEPNRRQSAAQPPCQHDRVWPGELEAHADSSNTPDATRSAPPAVTLRRCAAANVAQTHVDPRFWTASRYAAVRPLQLAAENRNALGAGPGTVSGRAPTVRRG